MKPWRYEEMKNSDEKVNIRAFCFEKKKLHLGGITHLYVINNQMNHPKLFSMPGA